MAGRRSFPRRCSGEAGGASRKDFSKRTSQHKHSINPSQKSNKVISLPSTKSINQKNLNHHTIIFRPKSQAKTPTGPKIRPLGPTPPPLRSIPRFPRSATAYKSDVRSATKTLFFFFGTRQTDVWVVIRWIGNL